MSDDTYKRYVLLNHMISRSTSRARTGASPPTIGANSLLALLDKRRLKGWAVEHPRGKPEKDDVVRLQINEGLDAIRLSDVLLDDDGAFAYASLLVEHVKASAAAFPVVHQGTWAGRELSGEEKERGAATAHVLIRIPMPGAYDDAKYRCVIEAVPGVSRRMITHLLCRQLRRISDAEEWSYRDTRTGRGKKPKEVNIRYTPRLELFADVGRKLGNPDAPARALRSMTFTKRSARQDVGQPTDVEYTDFNADVLIRVRADQGPPDEVARLTWAARIRKVYEDRGYSTRFLFRDNGGDIEQGTVQAAMDEATDLLMCSRELLAYASMPRVWEPKLNADVVRLLKAVSNRDEIWQPARRP